MARGERAVAEKSGKSFLMFAAASLAAVALGVVAMAESGVAASSWMRNAAAWLVGAGLAFLLSRTRSPLIGRAFLVLAPAALAATFLFPAQEGVHRWIDLGPLHINAAALLLPVGVVACALAAPKLASAALAACALLLVLQPDASQATALAMAALVLLMRNPAPVPLRLASAAATVALAAAAWMRPDPLEPVAEVEEIFALAAGVSPLLAAAAGLALAAASLSPLPGAGRAEPRRTAAFALSAYFAGTALAPAFGAYPVPLVGLGMSFPVGWWLAVGLLASARGHGR